jgi:FolB domain-containing protein
MDTITINELEVFYHVGVPESERANAQRLLLTVEMERDFSAAAKLDDLTKTIDYFAVSQRLLRFGEGRQWKLIEKLAVDVAEMILCDFGPAQVSVEVKKFIIPQTKYVSVKIVRSRQ